MRTIQDEFGLHVRTDDIRFTSVPETPDIIRPANEYTAFCMKLLSIYWETGMLDLPSSVEDLEWCPGLLLR